MKKLLVQMSGILVGFASQVGVSMAQQTFDTRPLTGFAEVPAIFSAGSGNFKITFFGNPATQLNYQLSFSGLAGGATQGHVHFGRARVAGGVIAFLCSNLGNAPVGTPICPASGTVTGSLTSASVVGPAAQGINPGEFSKLVAAIRAGATYVCVHSPTFPNGEIRAQIRGGNGGNDD